MNTIPASVPSSRRDLYVHAQETITQGTGKLFLFAGDQKVEHLNDDFSGPTIDPADNNPQHMFRIASQAPIGAFATQLGLIDRYGLQYPYIPYIVKLNSKTNIIPKSARDPISSAWYDVEDIVHFQRHSGLRIFGIGYTVFLGSSEEAAMLREAAQAVLQAHHYGMVAMVWIYPRGKYVPDETAPSVISGAAGVASCLGADYVKINPPAEEGNSYLALRRAVESAGNTKVICAGGKSTTSTELVERIKKQIENGAQGCAIGRNIHQKSESDAIALCEKIAEVMKNTGL